MANLKEKSISLLSTTLLVDMKTVQVNSLYTVPVGKKAIIEAVVVRKTTASLAGGTEYDMGISSAVSSWLQNVDLSNMTSAGTQHRIIKSDNVTYTTLNAGDVFGIKPITGATAAGTATIDVFGYEFDA